MKSNLCAKSGFTLVEILFVLLVIMAIIGFALPAFRAIRFSVRNARAQDALAKLGEARASFYQSTKGWDIRSGPSSKFTGEDAKAWMSDSDKSQCLSPALTGVPATKFSITAKAPVSQLFACGFLDWHDFVDLPYNFYICRVYKEYREEEAPACGGAGFYASAVANSDDAEKTAGPKYVYKGNEEGYWMLFERSTRRVITSDDRIKVTWNEDE